MYRVYCVYQVIFVYPSTEGQVVTTKVEQAKAKLRAKGITIKAWAEVNGFPLRSVRAVLSGHNKGNYGRAHEIAVALGMKGKTK